MKRIGIVTEYYNNSNYGALLQAFALQKSVENLGYLAEQITYDFNYECQGDFSKGIFFFKNVIKSFVPGFYRNNSKYKHSLRKFEKQIRHSRYVNNKTVRLLEKDYDAFICGSDQIWNPIGWQPNFFLAFTDKPKISYAASIARDELTDSELRYIKENTQDFLALSVREKNSADYLSNELGYDFLLVPDPTLLILKSEWNMLFPIQSVKNVKKYIFAYFLGFNEAQRAECIKFAQRMDMNIKFVPFMNRASYEWDSDNREKCINDFDMNTFIDMIRGAEVVLTDSYHGTVFSCIFERPFFVLERQLVGDEKSMTSRIDTLFFELNIDKKRKLKSTDSIKDDYVFSSDEILCIINAKEEWRRIGIDYLNENLKKIGL